HFDPTFLTPYDLGRKTLNVGLFKLAAQGVRARLVQISSGVNQSTSETLLDEVFRGMRKVADRFGVDLTLGNPVHSPTAFFLSLLTFGEQVARKTAPLRGDILAVTGTVGTATAGLSCLRRFGWTAIKDYAEAVRAHLFPEPPIETCWAMQSHSAVSAMLPLVDGISAETHRLLKGTGLGAAIEEKALPVSSAAREAAGYLSVNVRRWALFGGDDLGLLVSVRRGQF